MISEREIRERIEEIRTMNYETMTACIAVMHKVDALKKALEELDNNRGKIFQLYEETEASGK